jgi:CRP-like cAMP-binding protein
MASVEKKVFYDLCNSFSDIFIKMKQRAVSYRDPWKQFKIKLLNQIEYFKDVPNSQEFFDEI